MGAEFEHLLGLGEHRAGGACVGEREMGAGELEPDLDGQPRNAVVEQGPQAMGARERRAGVLGSALVECDACGRHMHERARGVVAEARRVDVRLCCLRVLPRLAPLAALCREERELCVGDVDDVD